jgi:2-keto-4-pentenoate hydratase/2-oxohepta-3-ene-1,7-dioic acid hydratase in catechol pathway
MKIVVFGEERRVGALEPGGVVDLSEAYAAVARDSHEDVENDQGAPRVSDRLRTFIEGGQQTLDDARRALSAAAAMSTGEVGPTGRSVVHGLDTVALHAPWPGGRIACAGGNYADHLARMLANLEGGTPRSLKDTAADARASGQWGFWKIVDEVAGPFDPIPKPRRTQRFDYEGEVAIVLGRTGKDISPDDAASYIWGVTLVNDWSIRDGLGLARPMSYNLAKNFDGCVSIGPCIVVDEDARDVDVTLRVNGELRQSFNSSAMIFSFGEILAEISRDLTLRPGDLISGGTAAGTAADASKRDSNGTPLPDLFLEPGDVVELSSPQIGALTNSIIEPTRVVSGLDAHG